MKMASIFERRPGVACASICTLLLSCAGDGPRLYKSSPHAPSLEPEAIAMLEHLGPTLVDEGANFSVYSERATRVEVLLFDDPEADLPTRRIPMHRFGDVWNVFIEGVGLGQHYGYIAWGPNWEFDEDWFPGSIHGWNADVDDYGNRFNPNKLLIDPYAKAIHDEHDWSKGSVASGPSRTSSTFAAASKSTIVESEYDWSDSEAQWRRNRQDASWEDHRWQDLVMYEVHPKGFTAGGALENVSHKGTFRGFGEHAAYLADLGINAVELMPVMEKPSDGGYWGYNTLGFFLPEYGYATAASQEDPGEIIDELKWMVDQLHQHGIEVILDVVYNHTGEGGFWRDKLEISDFSYDQHDATTYGELVNYDPKEVASIYSFRGLDNYAYYALTDGNQKYLNNSGVGNQTRANHLPMRKLITDSLRYWVEEMHIDGFRFDLAPLLGMEDMNYENWTDQSTTVLQEIIDDPVLQKYNTRVIAEPWAMGWAGYQIGGFPASSNREDIAWGEWNGNFRDWWRSFVNEGWPLNGVVGQSKDGISIDGGSVLTGSRAHYDRPTIRRKPYHSVNFVTVHDGFTMYDLFTYEHPNNGCTPLNPSCCENLTSPFCTRDDGEKHNRSKNWGEEHLKRQMMRNMFVAMLVAHGTPLILGGDEWIRTQLGNNNAYSTRADNPNNWFDWGAWLPNDERARMHDFVRKMIRLRKEHRYALAPADWDSTAPFAWKNAQNQNKQDWSNRHIAIHYHDSSVGPQLFIMINMEESWVDFMLPEGVSWQRLVDTQNHFDLPEYFDNTGAPTRVSANISLDSPATVESPTYNVPGYTIVVLEEKP